MNNWSTYRCNPFVIMFADYFNHTPEDALSECMFISVKGAAPSLFSSFFSTFQSNASSMDSLRDLMKTMNGFVGNVGTMFSNTLNSILDRIGNITSTLQYLVIKLQVLLQRISAAIIVMIYGAYSILQGLQAIRRDKDLNNAVDLIIKLM